MLRSPKRVRPALKYHGGDYYDAPQIIMEMPAHTRYHQPCFGGGAVLFSKPRSDEEIVSDVDPDLMLFYRVLVQQPEVLAHRLNYCSYEESTFLEASERLKYPSMSGAVDRAVDYYVVNRMSLGGAGWSFAHPSKNRTRGGLPDNVNAWKTSIRQLPKLAARLSGVTLWTSDVFDSLDKTDSPTTVHYVDPPFPRETRTAREVYRIEVTPGPSDNSVAERERAAKADRDWHLKLLKRLLKCQGAVILSSYRNPLYDVLLEEWENVDMFKKNASGHGQFKQDRVETLYLNNRTCPLFRRSDP